MATKISWFTVSDDLKIYVFDCIMYKRQNSDLALTHISNLFLVKPILGGDFLQFFSSDCG